MSRIGKKEINIPAGVDIKVDNGSVIVSGPKGEIKVNIVGDLNVVVFDGVCCVKNNSSNEKGSKKFHGLVRSLINNAVIGVSSGYEKKLEVVGVGYKCEMQGNNLVLKVGFSHPVIVEPPDGIQFSVNKQVICVRGIDKVLVGDTAEKIRRIRKPEPYKGKGIRYLGESIKVKEIKVTGKGAK